MKKPADAQIHEPTEVSEVPLPETKGPFEHRWSGWPGAWCLDCGVEDPGEACLASGNCPCSDGPPGPGEVEKPCLAVRTPCLTPGEGRADPYRPKSY